MADVSSWGDHVRGWRAGRSRGQLFLVGALALAVLFVSLAFLLNTAIYTENLATRSDGASATDAIEYQQSARTHVRTELGYVNRHNNTTYADLQANYTAAADTWNALAVTHQAANGHVTTFSTIDQVRGTRIVQADARNFSDANATRSWTLAENATVRNYTVAVEHDTLADPVAGPTLSDLLNASTFHVEFAGDETWTVYVYQDGASDVIATVERSGSPVDSCTRSGSTVTIDFTNGTMGGTDCAPLHFYDQLGENYDVSYANGGQVNGTYELTVDRPVGDLDGTHYHSDADGSSPYVTPAIYSANFRLVYRGPAVYYEDEFRVAPGEPDA